MTTITFRGTGDSMGVPRVYCDCAVCEEARATGRNRRLRSLVQIDDPSLGTVLIDCGPDWRRQMEAAGLRRVDVILLTHAHFDHIGGLAEWADACRWTKERGLAYAPAEVIEEVLARFPWLGRHIDFRPLSREETLGRWTVAAWKVNHGKNGYSYAYRFDRPDGGPAWVYCPDAIGLTEEMLRPMRGLDLLVLGTSFYHEPYPYETRSVYDVTEALELAAELRPRRMVLTHQSHDIDLRRDYGLPAHVAFAETGMTVTL